MKGTPNTSRSRPKQSTRLPNSFDRQVFFIVLRIAVLVGCEARALVVSG